METKKLKPFDLEAAKRGEPVVTRDNCPVTIYDFNFNNHVWCIAGKVVRHNNEFLMIWDKVGHNEIQNETINDLFMAPVKKEGWINLYKECFGTTTSHVYKSQREADLNRNIREDYITTVKIEWEE